MCCIRIISPKESDIPEEDTQFFFVKVGGQYESHIFANEKTDVSMVCISGSACRYVVSR